ncbi:MAG: hypothetical protein M1814_000292 [Vezdaea aestivalis]|nr:MAG: hypothetical protein M1814_000292 [Vezdaea aestivalis]
MTLEMLEYLDLGKLPRRMKDVVRARQLYENAMRQDKAFDDLRFNMISRAMKGHIWSEEAWTNLRKTGVKVCLALSTATKLFDETKEDLREKSMYT